MKHRLLLTILVFTFSLLAAAGPANAQELADTDSDGLHDHDEVLFKTNPHIYDTDGDGYGDGIEVQHDYDPNVNSEEKLQRHIDVSIKNQSLSYAVGPYVMNTIKISSGVRGKETPRGTYTVLEKKPVHLYKGPGYYYPNTKWNLRFKWSAQGNYYIHGAYWHKSFGRPMSHGCINVSYADMEALYNWSRVGTVINIQY